MASARTTRSSPGFVCFSLGLAQAELVCWVVWPVVCSVLIVSTTSEEQTEHLRLPSVAGAVTAWQAWQKTRLSGQSQKERVAALTETSRLPLLCKPEDLH